MNAPVLVCFAVQQEAKPFLQRTHGREQVRTIITGMGAMNAEREFRREVKMGTPEIVFTCGFAGALHPELNIADVVCAHDRPVAGAKPIVFACVERVAITVAEKSALRARFGADAVEMESGIIRRLCTELKIPCVTLRAISDTANENLPLDFNALMTADQKLSGAKLAGTLLRAPHKIPALMRLGRNSARAANQLAEVLHFAIATWPQLNSR